MLKLKGYGIQGRLLKWIENVLKDRKQRVHNWSEVWQIKFNYRKCNHVHLGKGQIFSKYSMSVNGEQTEINQVSEQKDLGVILDDKLKFVPDIQAHTNRAFSRGPLYFGINSLRLP